jgi:carbamoyltransferase
MRVLAIHSDQTVHESSCCIYDGNTITYFLEERYSGVKYDGRLYNCLIKVLETNLTFDKIVFGGFHNLKIANNNNFSNEILNLIQLSMPELTKSSTKKKNVFGDVNLNNLELFVKFNSNRLLSPSENNNINEWNKLSLEYKQFLLTYYKKYDHWPKIEYDSNHHNNHASLAFYNSGFDKAIVLVADGGGEATFASTPQLNFIPYWETESLYVMEYPNTIEPIYKNYRSHFGHNYNDELNRLNTLYPNCEFHFGRYMGLSILYSTAATQMGETMDDAGKAMGLSSYGLPTDKKYIIDDYFVDCDLFDIECQDFVHMFEPPNGYPKNYKCIETVGSEKIIPKYISIKPKGFNSTVIITEKNYKPFANYAKDLQLQTQEAMVKLIRKAIEKTGLKKVCISGGYGMNILANSYYVNTFPDIEFYFEPLSTDPGISIGCAMYHYRKETNDNELKPINNISFHGIKHNLHKYVGVNACVSDVAKLLYNNKSVSVFTGLAEAGQRALGNRSIFFNALNKDAKNIVNRIKNREWYRPFAAVVLEEDAELYFDMGRTKKNLFMTQSYNVISDLIPGVTHIDNTCRVQTVSNGYLYELLLEFKKLSGHGILLNTSFNLAGKPLVETPQQAIYTLNKSQLDYLWFEETGQLIS